MTADNNIMRSYRRYFFFCFCFFFRQNYYASLEFFFDVLTLFNVKITVKTKYQMSIDYSTSFSIVISWKMWKNFNIMTIYQNNH
jgi:hypothetical protein